MEGIWLWSYLILWVVVLFQTLLIFALMRQVGLLHLRIGATGARMGNSGPELGERAPRFAGRDLNSGQLVSLGTSVGRSTLAVFISPNCPSCGDLMPGVLAIEHHERITTDVILISDVESEHVNREFIQRHQLKKMKYIIGPEIFEEYRIGGSPYAVLIDAEGVVCTKGLVNHLEHLESLFNAYDSGFSSYDSMLRAFAGVHEQNLNPSPGGGPNAT